MSGIVALCIQDFKRLLTNALFWVITATLLVVIVVVNFALPQTISESHYPIYAYNTDYLTGYATGVANEQALRQAVGDNAGIGLLGGADGSITVLHPGLSEKTVRALMMALSGPSDIAVDVISLTQQAEPIAFNKRMTPVFIAFEALIIGFILGGALLLAEKEEETIKALRVAPLGVDRYLLSKTLLFSIIAVLYALLMAVFCVGLSFSVLRFILLSFFGAAVFSLIGLAFASVFKDMSSWFFSMAVLLSVNMLPVISYTQPSFSPLWLRLIPSYSIIFAYENILFGMGRSSLPAVLTVGGWCVGAYLLSRLTVGRVLLHKGGR